MAKLMSMKTKAAILVTSFAVLVFVVVGSMGGVHASSNDGSYRQLQVYSEVLSRIRGEYVEEPNIPKVTDGALHGLLESLDSNSSYLSPEAYKAFKAHKSEGHAGIGAVISKRFGYADVVSVLPGSPAEKAGIEPSDVVGVPPVSDKLMDNGIGYIKIEALTKGKAQEIASKVKALEKQGAKKILLDLRNCAEGDETEGIATANLFLNHGTITYLQGQKFPREAFNADPSKAITSLPLAILVNRSTSGAANGPISWRTHRISSFFRFSDGQMSAFSVT